MGANITFGPMHLLGLAGMPRRIPDFPDAFAGWNAISSYGSYINLFGTMPFFIIVALAFTNKQKPLRSQLNLHSNLRSQQVPIIRPRQDNIIG